MGTALSVRSGWVGVELAAERSGRSSTAGQGKGFLTDASDSKSPCPQPPRTKLRASQGKGYSLSLSSTDGDTTTSKSHQVQPVSSVKMKVIREVAPL